MHVMVPRRSDGAVTVRSTATRVAIMRVLRSCCSRQVRRRGATPPGHHRPSSEFSPGGGVSANGADTTLHVIDLEPPPGIIRDMTSSIVRLFVLLFAIAGRQSAHAQARPAMRALDSIVLERTACFGTCAAYRLTLTAAGMVTFVSQNRGDSARVERDSISPGIVRWLRDEAGRQGVLELPPVIADDRSLCPDHATDHPTAIVSMFGGDRVHRVTDYHGCFLSRDHATAPAVQRLRRFEAEIDSVTGSRRWTRPNGFR